MLNGIAKLRPSMKEVNQCVKKVFSSLIPNDQRFILSDACFQLRLSVYDKVYGQETPVPRQSPRKRSNSKAGEH